MRLVVELGVMKGGRIRLMEMVGKAGPVGSRGAEITMERNVVGMDNGMMSV